MQDANRLLTRTEVMCAAALHSRTSIRDRACDNRFPAPFRISCNAARWQARHIMARVAPPAEIILATLAKLLEADGSVGERRRTS